MGALDVLLWALVVLVVLILIVAAAVVAIVIVGTVLGLRKMRDDEEKPETPIFKSGGRS